MKRSNRVATLTLGCLLLAGLSVRAALPAGDEKPRPRIVISSDFPPLDVIPGGLNEGPPEKRSDPDDIQSMVRFLTHSNEFRVEGLIAASATLGNAARKRSILDILDLYEKVERNLRLHDPRYPQASSLRRVTVEGLSGTYGRPAEEIVGEGKDSEASDFIIRLLDRDGDSPVWFCFWGGSQEMAQALWKVRRERTPAELAKFVSRIRLYFISRQDGSAQWILDEFPDLFAILSARSFPGMSWTAAAAAETGDLAWLDANVRAGHGPLGAAYPPRAWRPDSWGVREGDSPSFLHVLSGVIGLSDPSQPSQGGWGGRFETIQANGRHWIDSAEGPAAVARWNDVQNREFAARMDWCVLPYREANHPPVVVLNGERDVKASPGDTVALDGSKSADPDGDRLNYLWWQYREPGSYDGEIEIEESDAAVASVEIPKDARAGDTIHLIGEVTDSGKPPLTRYTRVIVTVGTN